ncbi:hypothetical protein O0544_13150 [Edwardsiella anguillarum]|nr:hypothetical protein [Edwardsiella anguillarum]
MRHGQAGAHPVAVTLTRHPRHLEVVLRDRGQPIPAGRCGRRRRIPTWTIRAAGRSMAWACY